MGHISQEQASAPRSAGQTSRQRRRNGLTASFPPAAGGWMSDLWFRIGNYGSAGIYSAKPLRGSNTLTPTFYIDSLALGVSRSHNASLQVFVGDGSLEI